LLLPRLEGRPAALLSSPLRRARETAEPLAAALGVAPLIEERFREIPAPVPLSERQTWLRAFMAQQWGQQAPDIVAWREGILSAVDGLPAGAVVFTHFLVINSIVGALQERRETLVFWPANASVTRLVRGPAGLAVSELGAQMRSTVN
jgi:probable phosphoglycerate mutase